MHFSRRTHCILIASLISLNAILRLQVVKREIGIDSFLMHIMINSLAEYGYAKWLLHPLSLAGLYPYSYTSSALFYVSSIQQTTGLEMNTVILIYTIFLATISIFTIYLMAGTLMNNDLFKFIVAFIFSTTPAVVTYTTYTIGTRPLLVVLTPLLIYTLLNKMKASKQITLFFILMPFLFVTHHLFYFLLPPILIYFTITILIKSKKYGFLNQIVSEKYASLIPIMLFLISFSIPFIFRKFLEGGSRYQLPVLEYVRYIGPVIILSIGGLFYLTFKQKKSFNEWILLLATISQTAFIYISTYMKWFLPIFLIPMAGIGIMNILSIPKKKSASILLIIILIMPVIFTGYYQFIHEYEEDEYNGRYIKESTYSTGLWIKDFTNGNAISNDRIFSFRVSAVSDTTHFLIPFTTIIAIYGFIDTDVSLYERYPLSSEEFWFNGYKGPDIGEDLWYRLHKLQTSPKEFDIKYVVESIKGKGDVIWNHQRFPSKIIESAHEENLIYDVGNIKIWELYK